MQLQIRNYSDGLLCLEVVGGRFQREGHWNIQSERVKPREHNKNRLAHGGH